MDAQAGRTRFRGIAARPAGDAIAFDMRGADLSHHAGDCTFETILRRYSLGDPVLWDLASIVHEADLADDRYQAAEAFGLDVICGACPWWWRPQPCRLRPLLLRAV
jgi:hypothetical protein